MGKKKKKSEKKELPIGITLLLILLGSSVFILYCVGTGYLIDAILAFITGTVEEGQKLQYVLPIAIMGPLHLFFFISLILGRMPFVKKKEGESYREDILGIFIIVMVLSAVMLIALSSMHERDIDFVVAALMLPAAGLIVSPNIIKSVIKGKEKWTSIFTDYGNLSNCKKDKDFYIMDNPVSFEKKLYLAVIRHQILGFFGIIAIMIVIVVLTIFWITYVENMTTSFFDAFTYVKIRRATVRMFFLSVGIIAFCPAILSYYITKAIYRLSIVKKRKYIACHAIVRKVHSGKISLSSDKYYYNYKYATCIGTLEKNIHDTPATLVFVPDNVFVFPDSKYDRLM